MNRAPWLSNSTAGATLESNTNCHSYSIGAQHTHSTPETPLAQLPDPRTLAGMQTITASRAGDPPPPLGPPP